MLWTATAWSSSSPAAPAGSLEGEITRIVERSRKQYVGTADVKRPRHLRQDGSPAHADGRLSPSGTTPNVQHGDKVVIRITDWALKVPKAPAGSLVEVLGRAGENNTEMHAISGRIRLPYRFEPGGRGGSRSHRRAITAKTIRQRRDFRQTVTFTVDPADAKDFDDALSVRKVRDGVWEVGVHIADVTHYVRPGSVVDTEAEARGTSVYLVDRTVPMLPERLCNELCSLRPHEESLCFSAVFTLNENLEILDEWFGRTVIYSDRRFAYAEAQEIIETGRGDFAEEDPYAQPAGPGAAQGTFPQRGDQLRPRGGEIPTRREGPALGVYFKEQKESNQMIEEFMLLANRRVAEFCGKVKGRKSGRTMVYRVHDEPNVDKSSTVSGSLSCASGIFKATGGRAVAKELNKALRPDQKVRPRTPYRRWPYVRWQKLYTTDNIGHYGLAFPYYTHFTSPIRRYPDMMVHRLLARYLAGEKTPTKTTFEALCEHASEREVIASEAERASIKYKMVEFMQARLGEEFAGHISGITEWGIFVEIDENHIEGLVAMRDMHDDFYDFDPAEYTVTGRSTGRRFHAGRCRAHPRQRADLQKRQLDFDMVLPDAPRTDTPQRGRRSPQVKRRR